MRAQRVPRHQCALRKSKGYQTVLCEGVEIWDLENRNDRRNGTPDASLLADLQQCNLGLVKGLAQSRGKTADFSIFHTSHRVRVWLARGAYSTVHIAPEGVSHTLELHTRLRHPK